MLSAALAVQTETWAPTFAQCLGQILGTCSETFQVLVTYNTNVCASLHIGTACVAYACMEIICCCLGWAACAHACSAGKVCRQERRRMHIGLARRAREKVHRPQTRRRRENNEDSLDKMQQMRKNIRKAVEIMEHLVRREHKKLHIAVSPLPFRGCSAKRLTLPKAPLSGLPHRPLCQLGTISI